MQLRHRLSLYLVTIFSIVIIVTSSSIYLVFRKWAVDFEVKSLEEKTVLAAIFYLEKDETTNYEHETIKNELRQSIFKKNIAIYNASNQLSKGEMLYDNVIDTSVLNKIRQQKKINFSSSHHFYSGVFYKDNEGDFVVIVRENRDDFNSQLQFLSNLLISVSIGGIVITYLLSIYLGKFAYEPILLIINQLNKKTTTNFNTPVAIKESYAEIKDLVTSYNQFMEQLSLMVTIQKNFVDYISHELKTPITALLGTIEVTYPQAITNEEKAVEIEKIKQYTQDIEQTMENMMLLSGVKTNFEIKTIRIDDVIWSIVENVTLYHQAIINVDIQIENSDFLKVKGNKQLLILGIGNLVENAIKYSNNQPIDIHLLLQNHQLTIAIHDKGIGILPEDMATITNNFIRGKNASNYPGKGIGLSMATTIFKLHQIEMTIQSSTKGTSVYLKF